MCAMQSLSRSAPGKESLVIMSPFARLLHPSSAAYSMRSADRFASVVASFLGLAISRMSASAMGAWCWRISSAAAFSIDARLLRGT